MAQDIIQKHLQNLLMTKVNNDGHECKEFEDIFSHLDSLAKSTIKFGTEENQWLDLTTKKMIAKAIDPNCRVVIPKEEIIREKETLSITAYFYWSNSDTYAGRGFTKKRITDLITNDLDAARIETEFEALVMGAATSRALTDAGIGLEFYADGFEEIFEKVEEKEAKEVLDRKKESLNKAIPNVPSIEEQKIRKRTVKKEKAEPVLEHKENVAVNEPIAPEPADEVVAKLEEKADVTPLSSMSIEEAGKVVADAGTFKGLALEDIYRTRPFVIVWLYNSDDTSALVKDAAKTIILSDAALTEKAGI